MNLIVYLNFNASLVYNVNLFFLLLIHLRSDDLKRNISV